MQWMKEAVGLVFVYLNKECHSWQVNSNQSEKQRVCYPRQNREPWLYMMPIQPKSKRDEIVLSMNQRINHSYSDVVVFEWVVEFVWCKESLGWCRGTERQQIGMYWVYLYNLDLHAVHEGVPVRIDPHEWVINTLTFLNQRPAPRRFTLCLSFIRSLNFSIMLKFSVVDVVRGNHRFVNAWRKHVGCTDLIIPQTAMEKHGRSSPNTFTGGTIKRKRVPLLSRLCYFSSFSGAPRNRKQRICCTSFSIG